VSLHSSTQPDHRFPRLALVVTLATLGCATAGAVGDGDRATARIAVAEAGQAKASRYYDLEANKAQSMRALGRHLMQGTGRTSRYDDLEANKARGQRAQWRRGRGSA
jgi:hypothetical protein